MSVLSDFRIEEPAADIFRLGTGYVGFYLLAQGGKYTLVDSGLPGYWRQLLRFLRSRGSSIDDLEAQVLTHHHADHRGLTPRLYDKTHNEVYIHIADAAELARNGSPPKGPVWKPAILRYALHLIRHGAAGVRPTVAAATFEDGEILDVPGRPRVVHVPGHTRGHCCLYVDSKKAVVGGDALVGMDLMTGSMGPRIAPTYTNQDSRMALDSLTRLEGLDADLVLTVHGPHWKGPIRDAVKLAREVGVY